MPRRAIGLAPKINDYRSADWNAFRNSVIRADGGACTGCGRTLNDGVVLQVHHKHYLPGHKPWEYPLNMCATVCRGCHAAEHGIIPPRSGWEFVGADDLGDLSGVCEYCGESIRYVFLVQHANWRAMEVGEICCGHLTSESRATEHMDEKRRYLGRRKRFATSRKWSIGHDNIPRLRYMLFDIAIVQCDGLFKIRVNSMIGKQCFPSQVEAKYRVFDLIESGTLEAYMTKLYYRTCNPM